MATVQQALTAGAARLRAAGIDRPRLEARLLLAEVAGCSVEALLREPDAPVPPPYDALIARRAAREPLALVLGRREFWSLTFAVSPATLVPRPDSETLIEAALAAFAGHAPPRRVLDLGTGTGCLLLAALHEFPHAFGVGVDRVPAAARLARRNAAMLGLLDRAGFACADWDSPLHGRFDLVLANPPYIESAAIDGLMPEVAHHEPRTALDGGPDGLNAYRRLLPHLPALLEATGAAVMEIGAGQLERVGTLAKRHDLTTCCRVDMAGTPRALVLRMSAATKKPFGSAERGV